MNYYTHKINLVCIGHENRTFVDKTPWAEYEFAEYTMYNANKTYKKDTIFIADSISLVDHTDNHIVKQCDIVKFLLEEGYKVIIDAVWEPFCRYGVEFKEQYPSQVHMMYGGTLRHYTDNDQVVPNFFWIHEHLFNKRRKLNLYKPEPQTNFKKYDFLMPMRTGKPHRDMIYESFTDLLPQALYSYCDKGIFLPETSIDSTKLDFDRNFNPDWYDNSYFSVVTESFASMTLDELQSDPKSETRDDVISCHQYVGNIMLTEKTFKPIAFEHPFITFGQAHTLQRLRDLGFETFPHIFNERYDEQESIIKRLADIKECIGEFNTGHYMNPLTTEILEHNRAHFYNTALLEKMLNEEIVEPLLEFVNG